MRKGWLLSLRDYRWAAIQWIVAALLLPSVLGLAGPHPLSAEEALARDLGQSICSIEQPDASGKGAPLQSGDHGCTLCIAGCANACGASPAIGPFAAVIFPAMRPVSIMAQDDVGHTALFRLDGAPPRGPPQLS
ncbi:MAG: hypothetical protein AB7F76_05475 [Parvibaculaceae bacterium]